MGTVGAMLSEDKGGVTGPGTQEAQEAGKSGKQKRPGCPSRNHLCQHSHLQLPTSKTAEEKKMCGFKPVNLWLFFSTAI